MKKQSKSEASIVLCNLANEGKLGDIRNLAKDPDFMCSSCGRIAYDEGNLCSPVSLDCVS
jgi:hypothetical protein